MSDSRFTAEQFRLLAMDKFGFLEGAGFSRAPSEEATSPTSASVVYLGRHVGFVFSLDVRDQCVDAQVVKVRDGQIKRNWEGGYSADLFSHLVKYAGYRGRASGSKGQARTAAQQATLEQLIDAWAQLLVEAGQSLLSDQPQSLPAG